MISELYMQPPHYHSWQDERVLRHLEHHSIARASTFTHLVKSSLSLRLESLKVTHSLFFSTRVLQKSSRVTGMKRFSSSRPGQISLTFLRGMSCVIPPASSCR